MYRQSPIRRANENWAAHYGAAQQQGQGASFARFRDSCESSVAASASGIGFHQVRRGKPQLHLEEKSVAFCRVASSDDLAAQLQHEEAAARGILQKKPWIMRLPGDFEQKEWKESCERDSKSFQFYCLVCQKWELSIQHVREVIKMENDEATHFSRHSGPKVHRQKMESW